MHENGIQLSNGISEARKTKEVSYCEDPPEQQFRFQQVHLLWLKSFQIRDRGLRGELTASRADRGKSTVPTGWTNERSDVGVYCGNAGRVVATEIWARGPATGSEAYEHTF